MVNVVINSSTIVGQYCIANTGAIIEYDNVLADCIHVSLNATLAGVVYVGVGGACEENGVIMRRI